MVDFDRAVAAGMGLAIDLTPEQAATGFDRLLVLGLQLSTAAERGPAALEELLPHHQIGRSGFSLVPQGTPAHNSTGAGAGLHARRRRRRQLRRPQERPAVHADADPMQKRDGQWLAEFLGLDPAFVAGVHGSGGRTRCRPARCSGAVAGHLGYWMDTLFTPTGGKTSIFSDETVDETRAFFTQYRQRPRAAAGDPHRRPALRHPADDGVLAHPVVPAATRPRVAPAAEFLGRSVWHPAADRRRLDDYEQQARTGSASRRSHQMLLNVLATIRRRSSITRATPRAWRSCTTC